MKSLLKKIASNLSTEVIEIILHYSIFNKRYERLKDLKIFETREKLWEDMLTPYKGKSIKFLEFGVWQGYSIDYFSKINSNSSSSFVGFDSFEGLPTYWAKDFPKGTFNVNGQIPKLKDKRVSFEKGWIQNTLPNYLSKLNDVENLVVNIDVDLYSATLFILFSLDTLKKPYFVVFDEFLGHELRALSNYQDATNSKVEFIGKTIGKDGYPMQVTCRIFPSTEYIV